MRHLLRKFLDGEQPLVRAPEHWHPHEEDAVAQIAEAMGLPLHVVYARLLESMKIFEPLEEDKNV